MAAHADPLKSLNSVTNGSSQAASDTLPELQTPFTLPPMVAPPIARPPAPSMVPPAVASPPPPRQAAPQGFGAVVGRALRREPDGDPAEGGSGCAGRALRAAACGGGAFSDGVRCRRHRSVVRPFGRRRAGDVGRRQAGRRRERASGRVDARRRCRPAGSRGGAARGPRGRGARARRIAPDARVHALLGRSCTRRPAAPSTCSSHARR